MSLIWCGMDNKDSVGFRPTERVDRVGVAVGESVTTSVAISERAVKASHLREFPIAIDGYESMGPCALRSLQKITDACPDSPPDVRDADIVLRAHSLLAEAVARALRVSLVFAVVMSVACGESSNPVTGPSTYTEVATDARVPQALALIAADQRSVPWGAQPVSAWYQALGATVRTSQDLHGAAGRQEGHTLWVLDPALMTYGDRDPVVALAAVIVHEARHIEFGPHRCKDLDYASDTWAPFHVQAWYWAQHGRPDVSADIRRLSLCQG